MARPADRRLIPCACGCGNMIRNYNYNGNRRWYAYRHKVPQRRRPGAIGNKQLDMKRVEDSIR